MKNLFRILSVLAATSAGAGGIAVTNGKQIYSMAGFTVQYANQLSLNVISSSTFDISNSKLVQTTEPVSSVSFTVAHLPGKNLSDVRAELQSQFPSENIQAIQQPGAAGYFWEENSPVSLTGHYDLLTSNGDFVDIKLAAYVAGDGIRSIAPIVRSLVYDNTPPVVLEIRAETRVWEAGDREKLHLHITDDYSGVNSKISFSYEAPGKEGADKAYYYEDAQLVAEGNDWYTCTLDLSKYLPNRKFTFSRFNVSDRAGNQRTLTIDPKQARRYAFEPAISGLNVPVLQVPVVNYGVVDALPPKLLGFRPDASTWEVGSTHRVFFRITDDASGVVTTGREVCIAQPSLHEPSGLFVTNGDTCVPYKSEGNDWYSAGFTVRNFLPSGRYMIGYIVLNDRAGNLRMTRFTSGPKVDPEHARLVPTFEVNIHNSGQEDITPPSLLDWKVDASTWKAGDLGKVHIHAIDQVSGVKAKSLGVIFSRVDGGKSAPLENGVHESSAEGNDWYSLDVPVTEFLQSGTYYLSFFMIEDNAGNETLVDCKANGSCQIRGGGALSLSALSVEVSR